MTHFIVLCEHDVINEELAGRLRGLAGLRNRLVHVYDKIDDRRVHNAPPSGCPIWMRSPQPSPGSPPEAPAQP